MLDKSLPKIIVDICLDHIPINTKVWALDITITQILISKLDWQFDVPFWEYGNKKYAITPNQVIKNKTKYKYHYDRVVNANAKFPIDITKNKKGKWEILDGLHRLTKAKIAGLTKVNVRKVSASQLKELLR